ncbi:MAG: SDR family NAD(P)-dependent oxidoreductase [Gemmatimonadota bacterium]
MSGGGTGMGKAIAARLAADDDDVVIIGRRGGVLEAAASELNAAAPGTVSWQAADLTQPHEVERAVAAVEGPVDVLVNNAGGIASRGMPADQQAEVARAWAGAASQRRRAAREINPAQGRSAAQEVLHDAVHCVYRPRGLPGSDTAGRHGRGLDT